MATKPKKSAAESARRKRPEADGVVLTAPMPAPAQIRLSGNVDRVDPDGTLEGWCWSPDAPTLPREVAVLIDDQEVARFVSDQERADLVAASIGNGQHAFLFCLDPDMMSPGHSAKVAVRDVQTGRTLPGARTVQWPGAGAPPRAAAVAVADDPALQGHLDRVSRDGWVSGWCWYPDRPDAHVTLTVLVDDQPVGGMTAANYRPDLQQAGIGDGTHGFSFALPYGALADKGTLRILVQDSVTGRPLSDAINVRLGRMSAAEDRIEDLERQLRLLRGQIDVITRQSEARHEDRAARELFGTVAAFFLDLAQGGGVAGRAFGAAGLSGTLDEIAARYAPITLAVPSRVTATICIAATAGLDAVYHCIAALHDCGADAEADVVLLDDGGQGGHAALLPTVVRNLRYVRLHDGAGLVAGRNEVARAARGEVLVFLAPETRPAAGWLDELLATLAREPGAAVVGGRLLRDDGLLHHAGVVADALGNLRDPGHLASADLTEFRFMRPVDAVAGLGFAIRRQALLDMGGFSGLYRRFGHAVVDLCARLRSRGHDILLQPAATALWSDRSGTAEDGAPPDLSLPDEETLRLRERLRHDGASARPAGAAFIGHALVIDDDLPRPDHDAGSIATFEQMQLLRRLGWRVTLCTVHAPSQDPAEVEKLLRLGIEVAGPPHYASVTQYLQAEGATLDLVHIYRYANTAMLLDRVRELAPAAKIVFATADLHFLREQRRAELSGAALPDAAREQELRCMNDTDATIITSDYEYELLKDQVPSEKLVLLRWITRPQPVRHGFAGRRDICFVGNFRHPPNLDGVQWFVAEVLPLVRAELPDVRLRLAGSGMPQTVRDLAGPAIEVLGWVADLADLFGAVRLSVAPLRFGAGFKGKVATSLSYGLPVVGSSISLEGTGLQHGDGVAVADDPAAFAAEIVRLYGDAALWQEQSTRGLQRVAELYSPDAALTVWRGLLGRLVLPVRDS